MAGEMMENAVRLQQQAGPSLYGLGMKAVPARVGELEVGWLYARQVRDWLAEEKFRGNVTDWHETKGFLKSTFLIKGGKPNVWVAIKRWVQHING